MSDDIDLYSDDLDSASKKDAVSAVASQFAIWKTQVFNELHI